MGNDIRLVTKYMLLFDTGVSIYVLLALLAIMTGVVVGLYLTKKDRFSFFKNVSLSLLLGYIFFVLCTTVFFRETSEDVRYYLYPFGSYDILNYKLIAQLVLNVMMFVPIGFLIGAAAIRISFFQVLKLGCLLSVIIEAIQLFFRRGVCNIDDVIHNVIGCALGYGIFRFCYYISKRAQ